MFPSNRVNTLKIYQIEMLIYWRCNKCRKAIAIEPGLCSNHKERLAFDHLDREASGLASVCHALVIFLLNQFQPKLFDLSLTTPNWCYALELIPQCECLIHMKEKIRKKKNRNISCSCINEKSMHFQSINFFFFLLEVSTLSLQNTFSIFIQMDIVSFFSKMQCGQRTNLNMKIVNIVSENKKNQIKDCNKTKT